MKNKLPILVIFPGLLVGYLVVCFAFLSLTPALAANSDKFFFNQFPLLHAAPANSIVKPFPVIVPRAYLVADLESGEIFSEKNSQTKLPIASLTKLMTATVISEKIDSKKKIKIEKSMLAPYGANPYLVEGKSFSFAQLLYPILIESSNDAAEAASCLLGNQQTIKMMNEKARSLSMNSTSYADVHGLDSKDTSTARDLFYLARYIYKIHPEFLEISRGDSVNDISRVSFPGMKNKNLVYNYPNFIGGKTGYIEESKYNGLFIFKIPLVDGSTRKVAIIILGAQHWQTGNGNLKREVALTLDWLKGVRPNQSTHLASDKIITPNP